jgi:hypothetical protein
MTIYTYEDKTTDKKKKKNKRSKNKPKQPQAKAMRMINTVHAEYDHLLVSPFLTKQGDPRVPTIHCRINQLNFQKTFCDTGLNVSIMIKVTYELILGKEPLHPTYMQLQMVDRIFQFPEGIAKDVMVKIQDHYVPTDFMVLDMGDEEIDPPIVLGRPFLNTIRAIIYMRSGEIHFQFLAERYTVTSIVILIMSNQKRIGEGIDRLADKGTNQPRMDG